ncbi:ABC transporter substrate-binding protein [Lachnoclostridium sp. Marseille-P6806]|uniref:ABC transporter substrate-binding protein n=1 Tax=Lachnoclostridium sp. Marseille-P6806 TaxID=2364793 RepID=UPI0010318F7E|nr:ABC transporter substrate-binding protein [Lachnoclostridium sp. Marseille-P6806]
MKKRVLAVVLTGVMTAAMLAGCGAGNSDSTSDTPAADSGSGESTAASSAGTTAAGSEDLKDVNGYPTTQDAIDAIQERKDSGSYPTLVVGFMNFAGTPKGIERISQKISERTEETLGVDVELQIMDMASYAQNMNLMLASGEQMDLFNAVSVGFSPCVNKGYLYDMYEDDLFAKYGQGIAVVVPEQYLYADVVGGGFYGITSQKEQGQGLFGISIAQQYLDGIGYDYNSMYENDGDEWIYTDYDTITDIFKQLHEKYPDKTVFMTDKGTVVGQCMPVDAIGGDYFGSLLDPMNSLTVEDLFSSDQYMEICKQMYQWNQAGYFSKDALTDTTGTTPAVKAGSLMAYKTALKPGIKAQESNLCGQPMVMFQIGRENFSASNTCNSMPWCINSQTEDPVAAMQLLNAFYTDPVLSNLLCWGEEGVEYQKTDDGHITFADGVDASNSEYYNNVNWEMPNQFIADIWEGNDLDVWEKTATFNEKCDVSKGMGFIFDNSEVASEYTALTNVYTQYRDQLELGFENPEKLIPEMESALKDAGLETYMQAKQEALDAWAKDNGKE